MNLTRYNIFPGYVWALMVIMFIAGYFVGNVIQSIAIENNKKNTCDYFDRFKR